MGLWIITVEGTTTDGTVETFDAVVIAASERGAKLCASKGIKKRRGYAEAHAISWNAIDVYGNKIAYIAPTPMVRIEGGSAHAD